MSGRSWQARLETAPLGRDDRDRNSLVVPHRSPGAKHRLAPDSARNRADSPRDDTTCGRLTRARFQHFEQGFHPPTEYRPPDTNRSGERRCDPAPKHEFHGFSFNLIGISRAKGRSEHPTEWADFSFSLRIVVCIGDRVAPAQLDEA